MTKDNNLHSESNKRFIRNVNVSSIIQVLRRRGPASRSTLANEVGLSRATLSDISSELLDRGLLVEAGEGESKGGRKPTLLDINEDYGTAIGVKIELDRILVGLTNMKGNLINRKSRSFPTGSGPETVINRLESLISSSYRLDRKEMLGIGIGVSGLVSDDGIITFSPILDWNKVDLKAQMEDGLEVPVWVENDVNTLTLAEGWFGAGQSVDNFICVTVGEGIGMGIFLNGNLYRGLMGGAGEIGHMTIDPDGPICKCGERGCLETIASDSFLNREINELDLEDGSIRALIEAVERGDPRAGRIFTEMGHNLGIGLKNVVNLFNPRALILGGERMNAFEHFRPAMEQEVRNHSFPDEARKLDIKKSELGEDGWLIGASTLAINNYLHLPANRQNQRR